MMWHFTSKGRRLSQRYAVSSFRRRVACVAQSSGPAGFPGFSWLPRLPHKYTTAVVDQSTTYLRYSRWHTLIKAGFNRVVTTESWFKWKTRYLPSIWVLGLRR